MLALRLLLLLRTVRAAAGRRATHYVLPWHGAVATSVDDGAVSERPSMVPLAAVSLLSRRQQHRGTAALTAAQPRMRRGEEHVA